MTDLTRRGVLTVGAASAAMLAVAGCATYGAAQAPAPAEPAPAAGGSGAGAAAPAPGAVAPKAEGTPAAGGGTPLGPTSDVPVGGGKVFTAQKVVVTQPTAGQFKAFSAICTHQGCTVDEIANGTINCPCHGSRFNAADGSVTEGPAKRPLAAKQVNAEGGTLLLS